MNALRSHRPVPPWLHRDGSPGRGVRVLADRDERRPAWNLAIDEALGRSDSPAPTLRLWRNDPCVVLGRSQLARAEVATEACAELGLPVLRRFTGGGAVYHDGGNLNVTLVVPYAASRLRRDSGATRPPRLYALVLEPIAAAVRRLGLDAVTTAREIVVRGRKLSGVAAWRGTERVLVHGTLLVDADLGALTRALDGPGAPGDPRWERTRSRRVPVTSLAREGLGAAAFDVVDDLVAAAFGASAPEGELTPAERQAAARLVDERYARRAWHEHGRAAPANQHVGRSSHA